MGSADAIDSALGAIERRELLLLQWGYTHGSLKDDELREIIAGALTEAENSDAESIIEELIERRLLFEVAHGADGYGFRSRFAEGVRLLANLRQLFPGRSWVTAPHLVSDFRVDARARQFPRRDVPLQSVIEDLSAFVRESPLRTQLAEALLSTPTGPLSLSAFQLRAAQRILAEPESQHGIVISAGTGSGKTLAFYLPALIEVGSWIGTGEPWTKVLAVYPRRELLKDQFSQAFKLARQVDDVLRNHGSRPVTLGTMFGLTPEFADPRYLANSWRRIGEDYVCPFLTCPNCDGEMVWQAEHIERGIERLRCRSTPGCPGEATPDQVILTRTRADKEPPDLVFTTMEMLNQRLSDTNRRHVFGIHSERQFRCRLILLDEVHTYTGTSGAHSAMVLRRWRHAIRSVVRFVGLSATLREAPQFFAEVAGLPEEVVTEIAPVEDELDYESMEYQAILRGDPVSQTSLLSTSIQASFLLARLLDPLDHGRSEGRFGNRAFVFTDDLDVVNRLFDDLRDAEAYNIFGRPDGAREPLAALRRPQAGERVERDRFGQDWTVCESIGRSLSARLRVSRTTSQDAGVASASDVVVATSALELGFDDPTVGAIIQHKSPRGMAAFVQRKGRAGRTTRMRPWMVTVLSDYGRDRLTYETYDQLFDPTVPRQHLPIRNSYILRIQAVFAFIDWLATTLSSARGWWWRTLRGPTDRTEEQRRQRLVAEKLQALLAGDFGVRRQLASHLRWALQISDDEVRSILWEQPRPLMLEVIPTLARRIFTNWRLHPALSAIKKSDHTANHPLPDFLPANLFSELNLPEVKIVIPPATSGDEEHEEYLPIVQALRALAPGRVTRRFAPERGKLNHWIPVATDVAEVEVPISNIAEEYEFIAAAPVGIGGKVLTIPCYRPWTMRVQKAPANVRATSNAFLVWSSELLPVGEPTSLPGTDEPGWSEIIRSVDFYVHGFGSMITVRRFAACAHASIRLQGVDATQNIDVRFVTEDGSPAAIGFQQEVDGMLVKAALPPPEQLADLADNAASRRAWLAAYVRSRVLDDMQLGMEADQFQRSWLHEIYVAALIRYARRAKCKMEDAAVALRGSEGAKAFSDVMSAVFRIEPDAGDTENSAGRKLEQRLADLLGRRTVIDRLETCAAEYWKLDRQAWGYWLFARLHETLGEAILSACWYVAPQHAAPDALLLDARRSPEESPPQNGQVEIWISESTLGGAGVLDAIAQEFASDRRNFYRAIDAAVAPSDLEVAASSLEAFVRMAVEDSEVGEALTELRQNRDYRTKSSLLSGFSRLLTKKGAVFNHTFGVALSHRFLREGIDRDGDELIADLLSAWIAAEDEIGTTINLRIFCYLAAEDDSLAPRLARLVSRITGVPPTVPDTVGILSGVLWPRAPEVRGRVFDSYSPFRERFHTDPSLVRELLLDDRIAEIRTDEPDWLPRLQSELGSAGVVRIIAPKGEEERLNRDLYRIFATPVDVDYLQLFPTVEDVSITNGEQSVTLLLREWA